MVKANSIDILDIHYARELGCSPEDLSSGVVIVAASKNRDIRFAKGSPLPVYAISKGSSTVISVRPDLMDVIEAALRRVDVRGLDDTLCGAIEAAVDPVSRIRCWFKGQRLYCDRESFVESSQGEVRAVTTWDERALTLHGKWGGEVYGQIVDGKVVSWAAIKPLSDVAWDLSIETLPECRGHGYAKSAASAAVKAIFANGRLAAWGTDLGNTASLRTARALGFRDYGTDFGCLEDTLVARE